MKKIIGLAFFMFVLILSGCGKTYPIGDEIVSRPASPGSRAVARPALLRLEDVGPGGPYLSEENLHKLYAIGEYLHEEGIPFQVSLIPRLVVPKSGYDATVTDDTPYARKFVATIKSLQNMGGTIGIHGYTHQYGNDPSGWGFEFYDPILNPRAPNTYEFARDRIDRAIGLFERAGITPAYWETPHYTASVKQHPAFEEQTGLLYENKHRGEMFNTVKVSDFSGQGYRGYVTVPAPLGNIDRDSDVDKMIKRLDHMGNDLASFFYHPFREFNYLYKDYNAKGEVYYVYDRNSPLHKLVKAFKEKGYTFITVNSLVQFVPAQRLGSIPFNEGDYVLAGKFVSWDRKSILVWNRNTNRWHVYEYTAETHTPRRINAFVDQGEWPVDGAFEADSVPLAGDFNGDGKDDVLLFSPSRRTLLLEENRGGKFVTRRVSLSFSGIKSWYPLVGDFNGDGLADLVIHDRVNNRIGLALRTSGGSFKSIRWQTDDPVPGERQILAGDFNGDKRSDLAVYDSATGEWRVLLAASSGTSLIAEGAWAARWGAGNSWVPFAADVDGDGQCDLVLYSRTGRWQSAVSDGQKFIYRGDYGPWGSSQKGVPLVADLNGDGSSDLVIVDGVKGKGYSLDTALSVMSQ